MTDLARFSRTSTTPRAPGYLGLLPSAALFMACACGGGGSDQGSALMLLPETIGEWTRQNEPVVYDRESIFDYINGAGEVYRSYAFRDVLVDRYETAGGRGVTVEVFDMGNPEDAFGVFSYAREDEDEGIGGGFERKGSILCFWQNRFYVCVAEEQRAEDSGAVLEEVALGISESLPPNGAKPDLMQALPEEGRIQYSDRFFHTHQSLNYHHYLDRENVLKLSPETSVALARYQPGSTYLLIIDYGTPSVASAAAESFRAFLAGRSGSAGPAVESTADIFLTEDGRWSAFGQFEEVVVAVLGAGSREVAEDLREKASENLS